MKQKTRNYKFRITNKRKYSIFLILLIILTFISFLKLTEIIISGGIRIEAILVFILNFIFHFGFFTWTFNNVKISIIEMVLSNNNILTIDYYLLNKLKKISFDMNILLFRIEASEGVNPEIVIHDNKFKRLFKIRASNTIEGRDIENIIISFRNAGIKELEKKGFDKNTFRDSLKIIKVNYLSKDIFRNFWYV